MFKKKSSGAVEEIKETPVDLLNTAEEKTEVAEEEVSTSSRIINGIINVVLIAAIILAAVCTYVSFVSSSGNGVPNIFGVRPFSIQTDSMYPTFNSGDLIISTAVKEASELEVGDIITYWTVINGERVLNTHRITEIYDGGGYLIFATKGDNNATGDALTVHESEVVGKYKSKISGLGKVFDYLQTSTGFLLVIVLPVFLFFIYHLIQFFRVLFEYQNVKNRIKYEQERGRTEDLIAEHRLKAEQDKEAARLAMEEELRAKLKAEMLAEQEKERQRAEMEAELREKLKAELLAEMKAEQNKAKAPDEVS